MKQLQTNDPKPKNPAVRRVLGIIGKTVLVGALGIAGASPFFFDISGHLCYNKDIKKYNVAISELERTKATKQQWAKQRLLEIDKELVSCVGSASSPGVPIAFESAHRVTGCHAIATDKREEVSSTLAQVDKKIEEVSSFLNLQYIARFGTNLIMTVFVPVFSWSVLSARRRKKEDQEDAKALAPVLTELENVVTELVDTAHKPRTNGNAKKGEAT